VLGTRTVGRVSGRFQAHAQRTEVLESQEELMYSGESFYDLLGVSPSADAKTIKRAYLSIMKECHPDRNSMSSVSSLDGTDESTEFCMMLNEIYETLTDPSKRATYDALTGFSPDAVNPFSDPNQELDQVFVDEFTCIGCRNCCNVCPSTFAIEDDWGRARVMRQDADPVEKQQEAIDTCPVNCIHWVSSSQLSLLDVAMARMGRVSVWSMAMSGAGSSQDVFTEASLSWQKRFQELRQRRAAAAGAAAMRSTNSAGSKQGGGWWNNIVSFEGATGSQFYEQNAKQAEEAYSGASKEGRSIAALAAKAARASRTWRVYQETANAVRKAPRALSSTSSASSMDDV